MKRYQNLSRKQNQSDHSTTNDMSGAIANGGRSGSVNYLNTEKGAFCQYGAGFGATMDTALITAHI